MGDFNSRTSAEKDFVDPADFGLQDVDMFYHDVQELPNLGFLMERNSKDTTVNNFGRKLLDVCKHCNIFILNGRSQDDIIGDFTCKQTSEV